MSPNSDNAMARFLFAILKQKNLKDIDWNLVASDPVLLQPITNGHAARMRYSRFRATVTGSESQKRNRVDGKARVSKPKGKSASVKSEDARIKQENSQHGGGISQYSPMSMSAASPYLGDSDDFNARFLTPCSDDMAQGLAINPAIVDARRHPPTDFSSPLDFMNNPSHPYSPTFSAFDDATIDMSTFSADSNNTSNFADCGSDWADRLQPHF
jgi:hypothetical protein